MQKNCTESVLSIFNSVGKLTVLERYQFQHGYARAHHMRRCTIQGTEDKILYLTFIVYSSADLLCSQSVGDGDPRLRRGNGTETRRDCRHQAVRHMRK